MEPSGFNGAGAGFAALSFSFRFSTPVGHGLSSVLDTSLPSPSAEDSTRQLSSPETSNLYSKPCISLEMRSAAAQGSGSAYPDAWGKRVGTQLKQTMRSLLATVNSEHPLVALSAIDDDLAFLCQPLSFQSAGDAARRVASAQAAQSLPTRIALAHAKQRSPVLTMDVPNEATRRSHLRRILNAIIRRRNSLPGPDSKATGERYDAEHLPDPGGFNGGIEEVEDVLGLGRERKKRVLILMSDTGGGHRASAEALKATFEIEYGNKYDISVVDLWADHTPWPMNQMPKSYSFLVKHKTLWKMAFHATRPRFVHQPQMMATSAFVAREVGKMLDKHRPDLIISVHPLMQHVPLRVLRQRGLLNRIPFATVITDLTTCHPTWFHKLVTMCFCPTKEVAQRALKAGLTTPQLRVHGLPIRPAFSKPPSKPKNKLRDELGMDVNLPAVILIGGGEGMGPVEATARALANTLGARTIAFKEGTPARQALGQLVVVCGRNKKLKAKLEAIDWPMPTQIKGFVSNMPDLMGACDCIITKAGPGTIAESLIRGLPLVLNDFIAGQEVGNVPYVVENGAGVFSKNPEEISKIIAGWFGAKADEFAKMAANALKLARPEAVFKIVRDLDSLACGEKLLDQRELALLA